ncbi:MAG: Zn-dependent hydrolase [Anaerolineaceae bacterium]|nr:Zn-dependent hydrolase [Anaerolineaceae bacterium]
MLTINETRFLNDLDALAQIGSTGDGGVSRPALSPQDVAGRDWFRQKVITEGFIFRQDGAGNLSAVLESDNPAAKTLLIGSHLDSVVNGGRFDGALGTLAALETLRTIRDSGRELPFHLEAISFTDEEGTLMGLMGSSALAGTLTQYELEHPRGGREALLVGMARVGINDASVLAAKRDPETTLGYMEVHIEQGTRLEESGTHIGVVTAIVGIRSRWLRINGAAAHAGTMPMDKRRDALWGAAAFVEKARALVMEHYTPGVVNVGRLSLEPGAFNIVPGVAELALEFRHGDAALLDEMEADLTAAAETCARDFGLELTITRLDDKAPAPMDAGLMAAIEGSAESLGLRHTRLMSFAGHDAQSTAQIVPSAMFFVPSVNGVSHNPAEYTIPADCVNGANVLLRAVLAVAG